MVGEAQGTGMFEPENHEIAVQSFDKKSGIYQVVAQDLMVVWCHGHLFLVENAGEIRGVLRDKLRFNHVDEITGLSGPQKCILCINKKGVQRRYIYKFLNK